MTKSKLPELVEPVKPVEPEKNDENLHELRIALAAAVTALNKCKGVIVTESDIRTWGEPHGAITFKVKSSHALYTQYEKDSREYNRALREYNNQLGARAHGISVEQYIEAKKRFDDYQSKKCDKLPDHEIEYFVEKVLKLDNTPELTEA